MKYCDLVMKGGITSGIVYPNAVLALSANYRFKNIGGTSAGAIAAAASAAAAYGDRCKAAGQSMHHEPTRVGFEGLSAVANQLSRQGFIYSLFQPARGARHAYRLIVILAGKSGVLRKLFALAIAVVAIAPIETVLLLALLFGVAFLASGSPGLRAAALPAVVCAYAGGAFFAVLRIARVARRNLLGLCSGMARRRLIGKPKPALTEWLHVVLQELAGKRLDQPLTFDDLWNAPRYQDEPNTPHALTLQMITTAVSHHEPRTLPFEAGSFWFRKDEFDRLFPEAVVNWLITEAGTPLRLGTTDYYRLVEGGRLPVLIGMRMSLSFPLLISAVPLHEPTGRSRPAGQVPAKLADEDGTSSEVEKTVLQSLDGLASAGSASAGQINAFRICWFSDGGISSNFPIHLFDAPLPVWPTFAIDLVYPETDDTDGSGSDIQLPATNNEGWQRTYQSIARRIAVQELAGFLFGIVGTMQNWRDLLLSRAPGQRDRIVHVALSGDEGGMNLNMPQSVLDQISAKGALAGAAFDAFSFENHYWIRWRSLASALQRFTTGVANGVKTTPPIPEFAAAYASARIGSPAPKSYSFRSQVRQTAAEKLLDDLVSQGTEWDDLGPDFTSGAPRPLPQMQITPIF